MFDFTYFDFTCIKVGNIPAIDVHVYALRGLGVLMVFLKSSNICSV